MICKRLVLFGFKNKKTLKGEMYMFHLTKGKSTIEDGELLSYLQIVNLSREDEIVVSAEQHVEKSLFGSPYTFKWLDVYIDRNGVKEKLISHATRDIVKAYLLGYIQGAKGGK